MSSICAIASQAEADAGGETSAGAIAPQKLLHHLATKAIAFRQRLRYAEEES